MNKIILNNTGLVAGYQAVWAALQQSYLDAVPRLVKAFGNNVIISGCEVSGANISSGVIIVNGELLQFEGGPIDTGVSILETSTNEDYNFYDPKPFYFTRRAIPGTTVPLSAFVRLSTIKQHFNNFNNPHEVTKAQVGLGNLPNLKSNSIALANSESLATSKAIFEAAKYPHVLTGALYIGNLGDYVDNRFTITHNAGTTNYTIVITPSSTQADSEDVRNHFRVYEKNANNVKVQGIEMVASTDQKITLHYLLLKQL